MNIVDYGAIELKRTYQDYVRKAFTYSVVGHLVALGLYLGVMWYLTREEKALAVRFIKYQDLGPPPSITNQQAAPQIQVSQATARPTIGIPEPVPDAEVSSETTIATQTEMSQMNSLSGGEGVGEGSVIQVEQPTQQNDNIVVEEDKLPDAGEFIPVEEQPVAVEQPKPVYPEIARRAGIEGVVFIQILVDKTGKVRDVKIQKGPEMFHESAKEAAWKSVWRPAIQNQKPVAVWVAYPIRFSLK
ncbi:MAG: energy transducer TonB [Candidatus Latescibacteria bacterium]|nr:energy transducer TonB [Candidatus Latescibacterota bacterium]